MALTKNQIGRYSRHLIMPEVGVKGQEKLAESKVLCIGAGGLGSPLALYLASAGIGTIGIVDFDVVDLSNLQRQILHAEDRVGELKVESAKKRLLELNSDINVNTYNLRLTADNALDLFKDYDVIVDGTDNFATRYLVNDACVILENQMFMEVSSVSKDKRQYLIIKMVLIIVIYTLSHRHLEWFHHVQKVEFWESCLELSVLFRQLKQ